MFTIFNGRQRQSDGAQPRIYAQLDVTLRAHIADFKQQNSLNPFAVFIAIALHTNEHGWGWPTTETLKKETGLTSDRTIYAIVAFLRDMKLEGKRVLDQYRIYEAGKWGATYYHIFPEAGGADKLPDKRLQLWGKKTHYRAKKEPEAPPVVVQQVDTAICRGTTYGSHAGLFKDNQPEGDQKELSTYVDNSAATATPLSADTALKAKLPHLNPDERKAMKHLLQAVQNGRVVESAYNPKIVRYLIELGEIERCEFGLYPGLCLKGKPTADKEFDPDPYAVVQASLAAAFPSSNGNGQSHMDKLPDPPPAAPSLPEVPEGYEAVYSARSTEFGIKYRYHLRKLGKKQCICGASAVSYIRPDEETLPLCGKCGRVYVEIKAKAAAPKAGRKAKAGKAAIFSDARIFEAIGLIAFNAKDKADLRANGGRIGRIRNKLCQFVVDKLGHEPTPEETDKLLKRLAGFGAWYDRACDGCSRPAGEDTFVSWWVKYVADKSSNGAGDKLPQGDFSDPVWIDRLFVKRENGKLFCRPQVGEWREAVASEVEKWR